MPEVCPAVYCAERNSSLGLVQMLETRNCEVFVRLREIIASDERVNLSACHIPVFSIPRAKVCPCPWWKEFKKKRILFPRGKDIAIDVPHAAECGPPEVRALKLVKYVKSRERASLPAVYRSTADAHRTRSNGAPIGRRPCQQCGALTSSFLSPTRAQSYVRHRISIVSHVCDINRRSVGNVAPCNPRIRARRVRFVCLRRLCHSSMESGFVLARAE